MNINRHNCEAVFLDYYEKNLSPVEVAEVLFFLEENPDLKEIFESYEAVCLEHEKINFPDKEALKKKYSAEEIGIILSSDITRTNCEQFFIANAEGILSLLQKEKLNLFLLQYPELKKEAKLFEQCKLAAEKICFDRKEALKKEIISEQNREEYFVRSIENDLNPSEQKALSQFLTKHSAYKKEFDLFSKAILPAETIFFDDKETLKKNERKPVFVYLFSQRVTYYAAAAAILLLAGLFFILRTNETNKQLVADQIHNTQHSAGASSRKAIIRTDKTADGEKEENVEAPLKKNNQGASAYATKEPSANTISSVKGSSSKSILIPTSEEKQDVKQFQPIIIEDNDNLIAEKEQEKPKMMGEEIIAEKKEEKQKDNLSPAVASAHTAKSSGEYQTLGSFARKKIKSALGIKNTSPCEAEDKFTAWDLAMAAKNGIERLIGTKTINANKICTGNGDKVEYVFAAGNFEIIKSASR